MNPEFARRFLVEPDLFPARLAGAPWGLAALPLHLPLGRCELGGLSRAQETVARDRFAGLAGPPTHTATLRVYRVEEREFLPVATAGWELEIDLDPEADALNLCSLGWMGRIEGLSGAQQAAGLWTWREDDGFAGSLENLLRALAAYQALAAGGVLLHSAGVLEGAEGSVFVGRSGAGKSTLARLSLDAGHEVSSDDMNIVLPDDDGGWQLASVPFGGDIRPTPGAPTRHRLKRVALLAQGEPERLDPVDPGLAFAALFACAPFVNRDPFRMEALSRNLRALLDFQSVFRLTFARAGEPWRLLS